MINWMFPNAANLVVKKKNTKVTPKLEKQQQSQRRLMELVKDDTSKKPKNIAEQDDNEEFLTCNELELNVPNLQNGITYRFQVRAVSVAGPSDWSEPVQVVPCAIASPPMVFTAVASNASVTLEWEEPENNNGSSIASYKIKVIDATSEEQQGDIIPIGSTARKHIQNGLSNGSEYVFEICAVNDAGDSEWIKSISVIPCTITPKF